ncbi:MAG TPA: glycosyltransferase family 2 protein [bacterium]|jgi:putative glycosyltransferase|nr:glycosyltransferase family 2 protein [bacterium]
MRISVVTTLYQSAPYIREFYARILKAIQSLPVKTQYEIVFVDDGSPDNSLAIAQELLKMDKNIKIVALSRNFGHFKAILQGLTYAGGDLIFLIDCDLEEPPEILPELYKKMKEAPADNPIDVVYGRQEQRKGDWFEKISGDLFWRLFNWAADVKVSSNWMVSRIMTRRYVQSLLLHEEKEIFLAGLMSLTGFRQEPFYAKKGSKGKTTYTFEKKIAMFINAITSFSYMPLTLIFLLGVIISLASLAVISWFLFFRFILGLSYVSGWASIMLTLCFFGGSILASIGIVGIYLGKIFMEVKRRPCIVKDVFPKNLKKNKLLPNEPI